MLFFRREKWLNPLGNVKAKNELERSAIFMGKSTISTGPWLQYASIANCWHYQWVTPQNGQSGPLPGPDMFLHGFSFTTWITGSGWAVYEVEFFEESNCNGKLRGAARLRPLLAARGLSKWWSMISWWFRTFFCFSWGDMCKIVQVYWTHQIVLGSFLGVSWDFGAFCCNGNDSLTWSLHGFLVQ